MTQAGAAVMICTHIVHGNQTSFPFDGYLYNFLFSNHYYSRRKK